MVKTVSDRGALSVEPQNIPRPGLDRLLDMREEKLYGRPPKFFWGGSLGRGMEVQVVWDPLKMSKDVRFLKIFWRPFKTL